MQVLLVCQDLRELQDPMDHEGTLDHKVSAWDAAVMQVTSTLHT